MSKSPFDLIHYDIWGPFHTTRVKGFKYFLTIVDDHSRVTWTYLLHAKSEVQQIIPSFFVMIQNQFGYCIKVVRSNNAKELSFIEFFDSKRVIHYHFYIERPEQNSTVERKHQHLLNVARAFLYQSFIPLVYWENCVLTATYVINKIPTQLLQNRSPFEVLNRKAPSYTHLKAFGCLCYASTLLSTKDKFSPRSRACVFLGYPPGVKGYKLLDLESNQIFLSRDVIVHEKIFPFSNGSTSGDLVDIFSHRVLPLYIPDSAIT